MRVGAPPAIQEPRDSPPVPGRCGASRLFRELALFASGPGGDGRREIGRTARQVRLLTSELSGAVHPLGTGPKRGERRGSCGRGSSVAANRIPRRWAAVVAGSDRAARAPGVHVGAGTEADVHGFLPCDLSRVQRRRPEFGRRRSPARIAVPLSTGPSLFPFSRPPLRLPGRTAKGPILAGRREQSAPTRSTRRGPRPHSAALDRPRPGPGRTAAPGTEFGRPRGDDRPLVPQETNPPE